MSYTRTVKTIFKMESKKFFQNPKNILSTFLVGPLLIFLLLFMFTQITIPSTSSIEIYSVEILPEIIAANFNDVEFRNNVEEYENRIKTGETAIAIVNDGESVNIYYDSSLLPDTNLLLNAKKIAANIIVMQENSEQYNEFIENIKEIKLTNLNENSNSFYVAISSVITLMFFVTLMSVNTSIGSMATDAICGERERGTFDTLTLSGIKPSCLVLGKMSFITLIGFTMLIINSIALGIGLCYTFDGAYEFFKVQLNGRFLWFLPFPVLFIGISLLVTSLFFAIATSFDKVKQAMSYMGIIQIILSLFSYAPAVFGDKALSYVPISNLSIVLDAVLNNEDYWGYVIGSSVIILIFTVFLYIYSVNILRYGEMKK